MTDQELNSHVKQAYDRMGPSAEVRERVFSAVMEHAGQSDESQKKRRRLGYMLPVAACVVACAIGLGVALSSTLHRESAYEAAPARQSVSYEQDGDVAATESEAAEVAAEAPLQKDESIAQSLATAYPLVITGEGSIMRAVEPAMDSLSFDRLETAYAWDQSQTRSVPCEVADGTYVRYEGESVWYKLAAVDDEPVNSHQE